MKSNCSRNPAEDTAAETCAVTLTIDEMIAITSALGVAVSVMRRKPPCAASTLVFGVLGPKVVRSAEEKLFSALPSYMTSEPSPAEHVILDAVQEVVDEAARQSRPDLFSEVLPFSMRNRPSDLN